MAEEAGILRSHIEMAKDPSVVSKINEEIDNGCCAEEAVDKTLKFFADIFEATGDELTYMYRRCFRCCCLYPHRLQFPVLFLPILQFLLASL